MKKFLLILTFIISFVILSAEETLYTEKKLSEFLPSKELEGFTRIPLPGSGMEKSGVSSSAVQYLGMKVNTSGKMETLSVMVMIADSTKESRESMNRQILPRSDKDQTIAVNNKYKGLKYIDKKSDKNKGSCSLAFIVSERFLVTIFVSETDDYALVEKFLEMTNISGLEKLTGK